MAHSFELWVDEPNWRVTLRDTEGTVGYWSGGGCQGGARAFTEATLTSCIAAAMEALEYKLRTGRCSDNLDMFPLDMLQTLHDHGFTSDDFMMVSDEDVDDVTRDDSDD